MSAKTTHPPIRSPRARYGFTLIELLVVVTIIVVLLSLLAPAMDKAIYEAELAMCGANLKGIVNGVTGYAVQYNRNYPLGGTVADQPAWLGAGDGSGALDRRETLRAALGDINGPLNDPLTGGNLDFDGSTAPQIYANYNLFFGGEYAGEKAFTRLGDGITWTEQSASNPSSGPIRRTSSILASDRDLVLRPSRSENSHADAEGRLEFVRAQDEANPWDETGELTTSLNGMTIALWRSMTTAERGLMDDNFGAADGSVVCVRRIEWNEDERLARVPVYYSMVAYPDWFIYLAK